LHLLLKGWVLLLHVMLRWVHRLRRRLHLMNGRSATHGILPSKTHLLFTIPPPSFFIEPIVEPITRVRTFGAPWFVLKMVDFSFKCSHNYGLLTWGGICDSTEHMANVFLADVLWNIDDSGRLPLFLLRCSASGSHRNHNFMLIVLTNAAIAV
jgi:hypothetical protein